jgi:hypothetical protein
VFVDGLMLVVAEGSRVERIALQGIPVTRGGVHRLSGSRTPWRRGGGLGG